MINLIFQIVDMYVMVLILRAWLQYVRADFYNPFSQTIVKLTSHATAPFRKAFPSPGLIDSASLVLGLIIILAKFILILAIPESGLNLLQAVVLGLFYFIRLIGETVFWVMIANVILSWISQGQNPIDGVVRQLTYPLLAPIKRIVPPVGMIDFSVMIFLFGLYFLDYIHSNIVIYITAML